MALRPEKDAAAYLAVEEKTLRNWRWLGKGPKFVKLAGGAIRYDDAELAAYASANTYQSTTEAQQARTATR